MNSLLELYSPEINEALSEYGALTLFLPKDKINSVLNIITTYNKAENIRYFTDQLSSSSFERLNSPKVQYGFLIEFSLLLEKYSKKDLIIIDLAYAYSLNFSNPMSEQIAHKIKSNYFNDDFMLMKKDEDTPLIIFIMEDKELFSEQYYAIQEEQKKKHKLKYMATYQIPVYAVLYKNSPFGSEMLEFSIQQKNTEYPKLWYPFQSNARFTQNELRKKAFEFLPGKIDPDMVLSEFANYHDEFWPFIFSLKEINEVLTNKKVTAKLWNSLWKKANEDGESFNPEVYNNWWFIYKYLNEENKDQQRKVLEFEYYASLKKMGKTKLQILAEVLLNIAPKRRYNLMKLWSRSDKSQLDAQEVFGLIEEIPRIYQELTPDLKNNLNYYKINSWEKLHDYLSDQQTLLDYGVLPLPSQVALKFLEQKTGDFRCVIPYSPPEIKKLGKVFHNCLFSFTSRVQNGEICIATFFDEKDQNLCVAFFYDKERKIVHFEQALAKDNQKADSSFVQKVQSYILDKINNQSF